MSTSCDSDTIVVDCSSTSATPPSVAKPVSEDNAARRDKQIWLEQESRSKGRNVDPVRLGKRSLSPKISPDESALKNLSKRYHNSQKNIGKAIPFPNFGRDTAPRSTSEANFGVRRPRSVCTRPHDRSHKTKFKRSNQKLKYVSIPPFLIPKSKFGGGNHSLPVSDERSALTRVLLDGDEEGDEASGFNEILMEDFVLYRPGNQTRYPWQMVTLDSMVSRHEGCTYLLNGTLQRGGMTAYIEEAKIDINEISIDGLEDIDIHSAHVYLRTVICTRRRHKARQCWYRLNRPADEYRGMHEMFLWVVDLAKHVVDYLNWRSIEDNKGRTVHLRDFQSHFCETLVTWHGEDKTFQQWLSWFGRTDFRVPINRHREFLFNRAYNLDEVYLKHDLWSDLMVRPMSAIPCRDRLLEDTVVTPYVYHCCKAMPWAYTLRVQDRSEAVELDHQHRANAAGMPYSTNERLLSGMAGRIPQATRVLEHAAHSKFVAGGNPKHAVGKFAIVRTDKSPMKQDRHSFSYAYIQGVDKRQSRNQLEVIFLYLPSETICLDGYYPRGNELFFSDSCNCWTAYKAVQPINLVRFVDVTVGDSADAQEGFFVRQKWLHDEDAIVGMTHSDLHCRCRRSVEAAEHCKKPSEGSKEPLLGLGLFAGCGNFDIGLEQAGAIEFVAAIEINEVSLKTYAANRAHGLQGLILDSVNSCLSRILTGSSEGPSIGSISFISSGSPCKGFSLLNGLRDDEKGMRNCSLVASALSYIETFLPLYAVFENVPAMGSGAGNACSLVISCLVGLGYQVRRLLWDSRSSSSAQRRIRLFIIAASPIVPLPQKPEASHTAATGFRQAREVSCGLPSVDNDDQICIQYPDQIAGTKQTPLFRELIRRVPCHPRKMGLVQSILAGCQGPAQMEWYRSRKNLNNIKNHRAFTRIDPDGAIPTITTVPSPACRFSGRILHWEQHRVLTLHEAKRAQGFEDQDVIIGDLPQQWAQVGNAVNRQVAIGLGKVIADSWYSARFSIARSDRAARRGEVIDVDASGFNSRGKSAVQVTETKGRINRQDETREVEEVELDAGKHANPNVIQHEITSGAEHGGETGTKDDSSPRGISEDSITKLAFDCLGSTKFSKDEIEMLKDVFHPRSTNIASNNDDIFSLGSNQQLQNQSATDQHSSSLKHRGFAQNSVGENQTISVIIETGRDEDEASPQRTTKRKAEDSDDEEAGLKTWTGKRVLRPRPLSY